MIANGLEQQVLVLNRSWQAVEIVPVRRAFKKLSNTYKNGEPKAKVIDCTNDFALTTWNDWTLMRPADGEKSIRTMDMIVRIPEVIQLTRYDKLPKFRVTFNRRAIYRRDNYQCQYCGSQPDMEDLSIDHVMPTSKGGENSWTNCVLACVRCNTKKADKTLKEAGMKLLRKPEKPRYNFYAGDIKITSWKHFLTESYWNVSLENDM